MKKLSLLLICMVSALSVQGQNITGVWNGFLEEAGATLVFDISVDGEGYLAEMTIPEQRLYDLPMTSTTFDKGKLTIVSDELQFSYEGAFLGSIISGQFTQMGHSANIILKKGKPEIAEKKYTRPQTPEPPYPYLEEEVRFRNEKAGITLAGTLTVPSEGKNFPAVVLITGSGGQNRDEEVYDHRPFKVIADYLTRQGIAVLRYDDRGIAHSEGDYKMGTIQDFASDALAAREFLRSDKRIDPSKTGFMGHSEGGMIVFMIAGNHSDVPFVISLAGVAIDGAEFARIHREVGYKSLNLPPSAIAQNEQMIVAMSAVIEREGAENVFAAPEKYVDELLPPHLKGNVVAQRQMVGHIMQAASPEMQSMNNYDPTGDLGKIVCPVFALNGGKDMQVPAGPNFEALKKYVKSDLTLKEYPDLNHLFQTAPTGAYSEYETIEETFSPEVLEEIAAWILAVTGRK